MKYGYGKFKIMNPEQLLGADRIDHYRNGSD